MRCVIERVSRATVEVEDQCVGSIEKGFLIYVGIHQNDDEKTIIKMAQKVLALRIFEDENQKMNLNLKQVGGKILSISQFTLYGDTKGNNRPSFIEAARPELAIKLYDLFNDELSKNCVVEKGVFGAHMMIGALNDGPVTIIIEM
ncbi:MAG: D-tyrosyl-tRNA(Tyr) deacylase [Tenericutes bacterium HGW-Tenericutes-3]|nr:MAG: D-tyrosyl-tRNA(Tyr) deacylase [Tenericutes bacterium HGW-Tenericutes-3]